MNNLFGHIGIFFLKIISRLPFWLLYAVSDLVFYVIYYVTGYRKKVVFENLRKSFPEKSEKEIEEIAVRYYHHLCDLMMESFKIHGMSKKTLDNRLQFINTELFDELYDKKKNVIVVTAHYGNWEWTVGIPGISKYSFNAVYKTIQNKQFDRFMKRTRTRFGVGGFTMEESYRMIVAEQKKHQTVSCLIADQAPMETKYWTTFLHQETGFFLGAEKIARKLNMAVLFLVVKKTKRGYYEAVFSKICDDASALNENELTARYVEMLENQITEQPEYWLWSHRRWKRKRPDGTALIAR